MRGMLGSMVRWALGGTFLLGIAGTAAASELREVRLWEGPDSTRAVFDLDAETNYSIFTLKNPDRLVVDISNARKAPTLALDPVGKGLIRNVRTGVKDGTTLRVVLDLAHPVTPKGFGLQATGAYGYRLIFDLYPVNAAGGVEPPTPELTAAVAAKPVAAPPASAPAAVASAEHGAAVKQAPAGTPPPVAQTLPSTLPPMRAPATTPVAPTIVVETPANAPRTTTSDGGTQPPPKGIASAEPPSRAAASPAIPPATRPLGAVKPVVVAIDAGHGGEDPGAHGATGLLEKDVTLAIARRLAAKIDATPGMRAVLTRKGDYYVDLRQRTVIARQAQADLFVSIHANAYKDRDMSGTAVYVLSDHGATTEQSRWIANSENSADLVGGVSLHDKDSDLAAVLIDISQSATMDASFDLGGRLLDSLGKINELQKPVVQQAGFLVLKSPDIPSVLVETAFITNPREERLLASAEYQNQLADSICDGVRGYFVRYRPQQQVVTSQVSDLPAPSRKPAHVVPVKLRRRAN